MDVLFIFGAKYAFILALLLWAWYLFKMRGQKRAFWLSIAFILISLALTYLFGLLARHFYYDPRPFIESGFTPLIPHIPDNGFPSDHALLAGALAASSLYYSKRLAIYLWIIALFVAYSRVYVGVHHTLDVATSLGLALIATAVVHAMLKKYFSAIIQR
jgi:undecaprenyl-diphosphatase